MLVAEGSKIHALVTNINKSTSVIHTNKGSIKTWASLDSAAKWLRQMGLGSFSVEVTKWTPNQKVCFRGLAINLRSEFRAET